MNPEDLLDHLSQVYTEDELRERLAEVFEAPQSPKGDDSDGEQGGPSPPA